MPKTICGKPYPGLVRGAVLATAIGGLVAGSLLSAPADAQEPVTDVVGLVVTREPGTSPAQAQQAVESVLGQDTSRAPVAPGVTSVSATGLNAAAAQAAAADLRQEPGIAEVGLDTRAQAAVTDPLYAQQWSLTTPVSGANPQAAWNLTTGNGAVIAVIDSGITAHPDLAGQTLPGYDFVTDPVVANDGDGRDADPADPGDWVDDADKTAHPETFNGCAKEDSTWHGTHVAGLAAAVQNNGLGITGVAPGAKLLPVRALGKCGGKMSDIVAAITWASGGEVPGAPANPNPADVINLSLSSAVTCQAFVQAAIDDALARGSLVVASAGNSGAPLSLASPAGCYDVLAVGAVTKSGVRATYSNYGVAGRDLPLFASGGDRNGDKLISTVNAGTQGPVPGGTYKEYAGTSMAAPLVSGAAALLAAHTSLRPLAIAQQLRATARPFPAGGNCSATCGVGILDVSRALVEPPRLPGAVTALNAQPGDGTLSLDWTGPADPGTGQVTGYSVEYRIAAGTWVSADGVWSTTLPRKVITGLSNGVAYQVRVAARSEFGVGPWVESPPVRPLGLPGQIRIRSVRYPNKTSATVELALPSEELQAVQYRVLTAKTADPQWSEQPVRGTLRVRLDKGVRSTLEVRGVNALGASAASRRAVATPVRPSAVRKLALARTGSGFTVKWRAPKRTGLYPAYRVRINSGAWKRTKATRLSLRAGAGRLRVEVQPRNEAGRGPVAVVMKRK